MKYFSYEDAFRIPFLVNKSKDWRIEFDENGRCLSLPAEPVVEFINRQKAKISRNGYINISNCVYIIDIITQDEWPIDALIISTLETKNLYLRFLFEYDEETLECFEVTGISLHTPKESVILYQEE